MADTLPDDARCLGCGYALVRLPVDRCPECGRRFRPRDRTSYRTAHGPGMHERRRVVRLAWRGEVRTLRWLVPALLGLGVFCGTMVGVNGWLLTPLLLGTAVVIIDVGRAWRNWPKIARRRGAAVGLWSGMMLLALALTWTMPLAWPLLWLSGSAIDRAAARAKVNESYNPAWPLIGVLPVGRIERCGHGIHLMPHVGHGARGDGLFRREQVGRCRFNVLGAEDRMGWQRKG